jgi:hypothetical protein
MVRVSLPLVSGRSAPVKAFEYNLVLRMSDSNPVPSMSLSSMSWLNILSSPSSVPSMDNGASGACVLRVWRVLSAISRRRVSCRPTSFLISDNESLAEFVSHIHLELTTLLREPV